MFGFWGQKEDTEIRSICKGEVIPIEKVPDKMFSAKLLGEGVGIDLKDNKIYAPCDGEIILIADTKHAVGIRAKNGAEILIHIGIDTVNLQGKGFKLYEKKGSKIKRGQLLMEIDIEMIKEENISLVSPMILANGDKYNISICNHDKNVSIDDVVFLVTKR